MFLDIVFFSGRCLFALPFLDILNLFINTSIKQAPLFVEGWDEALHEIGQLSFATVLSPQNVEALLKVVENLPVLVMVGAEDALVSLESAHAMASKLVNSISRSLYSELN